MSLLPVRHVLAVPDSCFFRPHDSAVRSLHRSPLSFPPSLAILTFRFAGLCRAAPTDGQQPSLRLPPTRNHLNRTDLLSRRTGNRRRGVSCPSARDSRLALSTSSPRFSRISSDRRGCREGGLLSFFGGNAAEGSTGGGKSGGEARRITTSACDLRTRNWGSFLLAQLCLGGERWEFVFPKTRTRAVVERPGR